MEIGLTHRISGKKGFTLLELMIVVIVIGVLAALALPRFNRAVERGRQAEALSNLGVIRLAEFRYHAEFGNFTTNIDSLDLENPNTLTGRYFGYTVNTASDPNLLITATRNTTNRPSGIGAYTINIDQDGVIQRSAF